MPTTTAADAGSIGTQRRALERQLADLRRARGKAVADGKPYDMAKIAAVQQQLDALDDATEEVERRQEASLAARARPEYMERVDRYVAARAPVLAALDRAEEAAGALASALAEAQRAHGHELDLLHSFEVPPVNPQAFENRLLGMLRNTLRRYMGRRFFGTLDLSPQNGDAELTGSWSAAEALVANAERYLRNRAPA